MEENNPIELLQEIISLVEQTPNDMSLGKEVRKEVLKYLENK